MSKAVFLDRDGVINHNEGFVNSPDQLRYIDGVFDFARQAIEKGYLLIVVTNQGGIAAGYISVETHYKIQEAVEHAFLEQKAPLTAYYSCPHLSPDHPSAKLKGAVWGLIMECSCRKPRPGMLLDAAKRYNIDLSQSIMIGDMSTDIEAGVAAGVGSTFLFSAKEGVWPKL